MNIVVAKRGRAKGCITRTLEFAESIDDTTPFSSLEIRLLKLDETWSEFKCLEDKYYEFAGENEYEDSEPQFAEYETKYFKAHSAISNAIRLRDAPQPSKVIAEESPISVSSVAHAESLNRSQSVHLPKISIPTFSGDYKDWPGFRDLFTGTIDSNVTLTCTQKFHYLKSFLRGDAANLIKHISCSEPNYIEAWDKLERRYDQKHLIVQSFIQSFLSLPSCTTLNLQLLRKIVDGADEAIRGLNAVGSIDRDPWLIFVLIQKLDHETRQMWAKEVGSRDDVTVMEFLEFLQTRCSCLESCYSYSRPNQIRPKAASAVRAHLVESKQSCTKCKQDHNLSKCKEFIDHSVEDRRNFVKNNSLCFNCLRHGHLSSKCCSNFHCRSCNGRHHSLVHPLQNQPSRQSIEPISDPNSNPSSLISLQNPEPQILTNHSLESNRHCSSLLPTAVARIQDRQRNFHDFRLLLDSGSQVSFVTEGVVQCLGLTRKRSRTPIIGIASTSAGVTNGLVNINPFSRYNSNSLNIDCLVLPNITSSLPPFTIKQLPIKYSLLKLADPSYNKPGPIDILIGADKVFSTIKGASSSDIETNLTVTPTIFGWVISGDSRFSIHSKRLNTFCTHLDYSQEFDLERFWKLEEISSELPISLQEQLAEESFAKTHIRHLDGRYEVELPFKPSKNLEFGDSFNTALQRFYSLERRFKLNNDLKAQYSAFLNEYLDLGHMEEIPKEETLYYVLLATSRSLQK